MAACQPYILGVSCFGPKILMVSSVNLSVLYILSYMQHACTCIIIMLYMFMWPLCSCENVGCYFQDSELVIIAMPVNLLFLVWDG